MAKRSFRNPKPVREGIGGGSVHGKTSSGLWVSELIGLKWDDVHPDSLTIDERFSRGEWGCPKTNASSATIGVDERVVQRILGLKGMEVTIN